MGTSTSVKNILEEIFKSKIVIDPDGIKYPLKANIAIEEGEFIRKIISEDPSITRILEIGFAQGISALYISEVLTDREGSYHLVLDPNQSKKWKNIGLANLARAGVKNFEFRELGSEIVLPQLLQQKVMPFDMVFIDGLHLFDQVIVDIYYASKLLKVGGYIVIDDCSWYSVSKAVSFFVQYPAYKVVDQVRENSKIKKLGRFVTRLLPWRAWMYVLPMKLLNLANRFRFTSMIAIQKISPDIRGGHWSPEI